MDAMEKFGKYVLVKLIAMGGMAEVFLAKEFGISGFQRILAIKRVLPHLARDREFIEMFTGEARLSAQLTHPNIVQVYEFGLVDQSYYLAMEYIDGLTLSDLLSAASWKNELLPLDLSLLIMVELCQGLEYAHNKRSLNNEPLNLVHRDISPKNAMLSYDGAVKLMDFGIAKAADQQRQETISGTIKGKISYLSPEQVMGAKLDRRSDIFSLGIVFYELLTLQKCFSGDNEFAILYKIRMGEVGPPSRVNPAIPPELDAIIMKALQHDLDTRYQSAEEMLTDLNQFRYKAGLLASNSKLASFMRALKTSTEEDTLSSLQKIDWSQVEAQFGDDSTASLRANFDTPASDAAAEQGAPRTKTSGKGIKAQKSDGVSEKSRKIAVPPGKDTSKRIRSHADGDSSKSASGTKKPSSRPMRAVEEEEEDFSESEHHEPEGNRLVPLLLAFSVVLLVVSLGTFGYIWWSRVVAPPPVPEPTPTQVAQISEPVPTSAPVVSAIPTAETSPPPATALTEAPPATAVEGQPTAPAKPSARSVATKAPPQQPSPLRPAVPPTATTAPAGPLPPAPTEPPVVTQQTTPAVGPPEPTSAVPPPVPPTEPPPPTNTPVKKLNGTLVVQSSVPVDLFLGGRNLGRLSGSGLKTPMPPGSYDLVAVGYVASPPAFYRAEFSVTVTAGQNTVHSVKYPELGTLNITSTKPATLFVDNVRVDQTPIPRLGITAGPHELRFDFKSGEVSRQRYQVRPGQFATVFGKL